MEKLNRLYSNYCDCDQCEMFSNEACNHLVSDAVPTIFPSLEGSSAYNSDHSYN